MTNDRYADWDAAYVLGALSSADRRAYEEHLALCPDCRRGVGELAGMPGMLASVEPAEVLALDLPPDEDSARAEVIVAAERTPHNLKPTKRRGLSRGRGWLAAAAALLVLGGAGAGGYTIADAQRPPAQVIAGPTRLAFSPVVPSSMTAVVDVTPVGAQTAIKVECQYSGYGADPSSSADYSVWAVGQNGRADLVATWRAQPDQVMRPSGSVDLPAAQLAAVEIRRADSGQTIMRASVS